MAATITALCGVVGRSSDAPISSRVSFEPASDRSPASLRFAARSPSTAPSLYRPAPADAPSLGLRALAVGGGGDQTLAEGSTRSSSFPPRRSGTMPRAATPRAVSTLIDEGFDALRVGDHEGAERSWRAALELDPDNRLLLLNLQKLAVLGGRSHGVAER